MFTWNNVCLCLNQQGVKFFQISGSTLQLHGQTRVYGSWQTVEVGPLGAFSVWNSMWWMGRL